LIHFRCCFIITYLVFNFSLLNFSNFERFSKSRFKFSMHWCLKQTNNEHQGPQHTILSHTQIYTSELRMFSVGTRIYTLHPASYISNSFWPIDFRCSVHHLFQIFTTVIYDLSNARLRSKNTHITSLPLSISSFHCVKIKDVSHECEICRNVSYTLRRLWPKSPRASLTPLWWMGFSFLSPALDAVSRRW
jgi:hypothetical protein